MVVAVHNEGAPIPAEARERILKPFRRGGSSEADEGAGQGTGLGLYIARRMAEAHGGSIDVESPSEEKSTFTVRLPPRRPDRGTG